MKELYESMMLNSKLRPFIPAVKVLAAHMVGIEEHFPDFALQLELVETEDEMWFQIMQQPFLDFAFLDEHDNAWCPSSETFKAFAEKHGPLKLGPDIYPLEKRMNFYRWVISLCEWEQVEHQSFSFLDD